MGRKPTDTEKAPLVQELLQKNPKITKQAIADELGIGVASVYRILQEDNNQTPRKGGK